MFGGIKESDDANSEFPKTAPSPGLPRLSLFFLPFLFDFVFNSLPTVLARAANAGLQLRRAIRIPAEGRKLLEKDAIAPSASDGSLGLGDPIQRG